MIDISDPENLSEIARFDAPRTARFIRVVDSYAWIGDYRSLRVLDISKPSSIRELASFKTPGYVEDVWAVNSTAFVANDDAGLLVLDMEWPENSN